MRPRPSTSWAVWRPEVSPPNATVGHGHADGEGVAREEPDVAQQGGGAGLLVAAEPDGDGVEEADLAVVEVAVGGRGVRGLERLAP